MAVQAGNERFLDDRDDGPGARKGVQDLYDDSFVILTGPVRMSFIYRYLLALVPVFLVVMCIFVRQILGSLFHIGSSSLSAAVPDYLSPYATGIATEYSASINDATTITILAIAPVGIFLVVVAIGWAARLSELWTGTLLTLVLSGMAALALTPGPGAAPVSGAWIIHFLQWIAFLVQPFSVVAAILVIFGSERFRRSIEYRITRKGIRIRGGLAGVQEHMIPHGQVGRIVFEQDYFGARFNFGTLIPYSTTRWGAETSIRGIGAAGQKNNIGIGVGFAKGREEGSRYPLDCLFGIPDPLRVQEILTEYLCHADNREDEQVAYLKKLYEISVAKAPAGIVPDTTARREVTDVQNTLPDPEIDPVIPAPPAGRGTPCPPSPVIRISELDPPGSRAAGPGGGTIREIPPLPKPKAPPKPSEEPRKGSESPLDQIKKLAELRDAGIITEGEFAAKKTELLKRV